MNMTMFRTVLTALVATLWLAAMGESRPAQSPDATTTTFTYTATERLSRFEEISYFVGATAVQSHTWDSDTGIGTVVYEGAVTELGSYCLMFTYSLKAIVIPEGVTTIGLKAFYGSSLENITLPKSLTTIEGLAFDSCSSLSKGKLIVDDIGWWCGISFGDVYSNPLYYAKRLYSDPDTEITSLVIPEGVTALGNNVFSHAEDLTTVSFPTTLTSIGDNAFSGCSNLTSVNLQEGVTTIGGNAFNRCSSLTTVTIPEGVTTIGSGAFAYSGLTALTLPSTIRNISQSFYYCPDLAELTLTDGITTLGASFYGCTSLKSVHIPGSIHKITSSDFSGCSSLETVILDEGVEVVDMGACESLSSINFPSTVTKIAGFTGCKALAGIAIPRSVTSMSGFKDCTGLERITIEERWRLQGW